MQIGHINICNHAHGHEVCTGTVNSLYGGECSTAVGQSSTLIHTDRQIDGQIDGQIDRHLLIIMSLFIYNAQNTAEYRNK